MGKKRVHEIAKELGFQNRDLIDKLQKLGFEVKSHSSTVDEEDVRRALKKEEEERRARTEEKRLNKKVIRRRPKGGSKTIIRRRPAAAAAAAETPAVEKTDAATATAEAPKTEAPATAEDAPKVEAAPAVTAEATETPAEATEAPAAEAGTEEVKAEASDETKAEAAAEEPTAEEKPAEPKKEARSARVARPDHRSKREEVIDEEDEKPQFSAEDLGLSESDFLSEDAERNREARIAPPPPSAAPVMARDEEPASKVVRRIDPAVLKARLASAKRPEPPKEWGKPGDIPASPVTELVVRTDASGKRRELVDVRKERAQRGRTGQKRREEMSAKDLLEHRRGQVYYPSVSKGRRMRTKTKPKVRTEPLPPVPKKPIQIGETITPAEMAKQMSYKTTDLIRAFMRKGVMAGINQPVAHQIAKLLATELGWEVESKVFDSEARLSGKGADQVLKERENDPDAVTRAPVVTVMGHVDHGKTSLLDKIRNANVVAGEAGGITQAIAGYQVNTSKGLITFLDTPGHKAFTAMRARGADVTDIVILVVAADDGVMPQTEEAIAHAKAANKPIVVAVNKIDKAEANPQRVLQELAGHGVQVEQWGGDVLCKEISALQGTGIEELLEQVALQAEIMELKANPKVPAVAHVVEAEIHKGRGPVATILVREGTLKVGEAVIVGEAVGKVRAILNDQGKRIKVAGPSLPVQILGLDGVPAPGDELRVAKSLDDARKLRAHREQLRRETELASKAKVSLKDLFARLQDGGQKELKIVIKADVQGSVEALRSSLSQLSTQKVKVNVIHGGVGAVVESDVEFARASDAIIIGFGVRPDTKALKAARALGGVDIRTHNIIYECVDEVRLAMQGLLAPVSEERYLGRAEVRATFSVPRVGTVAGCFIVDGTVSRNAQIRLLRDSKPLYEGKLSSLKRFKDDVREVKEGFECGMGIEKYNDIKVGDIIEAFEIVEVAAVLDEPVGGDEVRL